MEVDQKFKLASWASLASVVCDANLDLHWLLPTRLHPLLLSTSAPQHLSIRPSVPHLQQTQLQFPPHPIFESTIYCEDQSPNPFTFPRTFTTHYGSASHDSHYPCTCRSPNHESPHVASRLRRTFRCKPVRPTQHDKGESFELSHRKSSGAAAVFYLDGSFVKL